MAKLLNLDEVLPANEKVIILKGKEHVMAALTVQRFIELTREAEEYAEKEMKVSESFERFVATILDSFPTIKEAELRAMDLQRLKLIVDFIRAEAEAETEGAPEGEGVKK